MDRVNIAVFPDLRNAVLRTIAYADVFDYPLTSRETHRYLTGMRANPEDVDRVLRASVLESALFHAEDGYYMLPNRAGLPRLRLRRKQIAAQMWPQAIHYGQVIAHLPFVRMVAVSGSLAMNNVDRDPDIDYFIVTARGRLWMARAMALGVARVAAARNVRLCPNYLIAENALVLPDQTLYAAHELAQMVPIYGLEVYERICRLNSWKDRFLPNARGLPPVMDQIEIDSHQPIGKKPVGKRLFEQALELAPGDWLERWEMRRKIWRLTNEQRDSPESCFGADYCKGHNLQHGQRTERVLRERLESLRLGDPA